MFCENFEIAAVQKYANLIELEKCCRTHIWLQKFVLIQPRTSPPKICKILEKCIFRKCIFRKCIFRKFANFWRARSRLYQNEILQEKMRSTAFFKLYKIYILLHRCNLKIFAKNRFEKTAIYVKFEQKIANFAKYATLNILSNFKNFSLRIW